MPPASPPTGWPDVAPHPFTATPFGISEVWTAAQHDLFGTKDVQDAITASYVWMADQVGHIFLGLAPTLLLCWIWSGLSTFRCIQEWFVGPLPPGCPPLPHALDGGYVVAALPVFAYWAYKELQDRADSVANARHVFPFDGGDIWRNVGVALLFFGIGGALAVAAFIGPWLLLAVFLVAAGLALRATYWWLQRKLAFQQADLPYLFRLANFPTALAPAPRQAVLDVSAPPAARGAGRHLIVTGPIGAGKTSLCVGAGTEFAFRLGIGRFLSRTKLLQLAAELPPGGMATPSTVMDYDAGRYLWPWRAVELLIVDDVDAGVPDGPARLAPHELADTLEALAKASPPLAWLAERRSLWVLGETEDVAAWQAALGRIIGVAAAEIGVVALPPLVPAAGR